MKYRATMMCFVHLPTRELVRMALTSAPANTAHAVGLRACDQSHWFAAYMGGSRERFQARAALRHWHSGGSFYRYSQPFSKEVSRLVAAHQGLVRPLGCGTEWPEAVALQRPAVIAAAQRTVEWKQARAPLS